MEYISIMSVPAYSLFPYNLFICLFIWLKPYKDNTLIQYELLKDTTE